jgi:hypothetical protein
MVMKQTPGVEREYRVVAAGVFKATCLQLLDEVYENRNLAILVTKRGKLIGQLIGPPQGITLSGPTVHKDDYPVGVVSTIQADARAAFEEHSKKKKDKKKKRK